MTWRFRNVLGEAMTHLKRADVLAATAVIQRSLGIRPAAKGRQAADTGSKAAAPDSSSTSAAHAADTMRRITLPPPDGSGRPAADEQAKTLKRAAGFTTRTYHSNAGSLSYKLYVPAQCPADDVALIVMLHGCTQEPDDFARGTGMNALADEFGFIVAYPHQPRTANPQGCWNWFDDRHQHRDAGEPLLLAGLAQDLAREFRIGGDRIFAAGLSAGGAMADVLASTYPDVFAAVGIHSGLPAGAAKTMLSALTAMKGVSARAPQSEGAKHPVVRKIIFHGDADKTVNVANGQKIFSRARSRRCNVVEVSADTTVNGRKVTRTSMDRPDGTSLADYWVVHGSGHAWTGGQQGGSFVETAGPDASREMVRFFLQR